MLGFNNLLERDHANMVTSDEFGSVCVNVTQGQTFDIIKTDAFIEVTAEGLPIVEDKPMFNTPLYFWDSLGVQTAVIIEQFDNLLINGVSYTVRDVKKDGIGGLDVYLKDGPNV